jgi:hypothetical protein
LEAQPTCLNYFIFLFSTFQHLPLLSGGAPIVLPRKDKGTNLRRLPGT